MSNGNPPVPNDANADEPGLMEVPEAPVEPASWLGLANFHSNETLAMLQRFDHIENLIRPGHHFESEGNFCEDLLRAFLRETLPSRFSVDTGFILGSSTSVPWRSANAPAFAWKQTAASPQIDIIVHDTDNYSPVLRTGEFVIVLPDSVRAVIEVKKRLTSGQLKSALQNLAVTIDLMTQWTISVNRLPFTGVFAFEADEDLVPNGDHISATYNNRYNEICGPFRPALAIPDLTIIARHAYLGRVAQADYAQPLRVSWGLVMHAGVNYSGQLLLLHLMKRLQLPEMQARVRRFQWPVGFPYGGQLQFEHPTVARDPLPVPG